MGNARARLLGLDGSPSWASHPHGGHLCSNAPSLYAENDDTGDCNFDSVAAAFVVDVCASLREELHAISELCRSSSIAIAENANGLFSMALQNMDADASMIINLWQAGKHWIARELERRI